MKRGLALALSALAVVGCKDKERADKRRAVGQVSDRSGSSPPPIGITGIAVETVEPKRPREIYERQLAKSLAALLDRSPHFVANPGDRDDVLRARITARIQYDVIAKNDEGHVLAAVELEVAWQAIESLAPARAQVLAERKIGADERANLDGVTATHVERALEDAGRQLIAAEAVRRAPVSQVLEELRSGANQRVEWALTVVAERRLPGTFAAVVPLLDSADRRVRGRAVGALVALRDPRGVDALTKRAQFGDEAFLRTVIEAVSVIGGEDAATYLEFVAAGHEDPEVKRHATDALRRMRERKGTRGD